jgi:hypothetical protein
MMIVAAALAVTGLAGCVETPGGGMGETSSRDPLSAAAESACLAEARRLYGGSPFVVSSSFSQAASEVIVGDNLGRYRCAAENDGSAVFQFDIL